VPVDGAPVRGAADAPVTLVEFSDFHCPFCKRVQPTLAQLLERYPGKVKIVYRDFPIDSLHPQARARPRRPVVPKTRGSSGSITT